MGDTQSGSNIETISVSDRLRTDLPTRAEIESLREGSLTEPEALTGVFSEERDRLLEEVGSFESEAGRAMYGMLEARTLADADEAHMFAAIDAEIADSDKNVFQRFREGDWGYFSYQAAKWLKGIPFLGDLIPDFLDIKQQKQEIMQLVTNPHSIVVNLRDKVERTKSIPKVNPADFGLAPAKLDKLIKHFEDNPEFVQSFPYDGGNEEKAEWWKSAFDKAKVRAPSATVTEVLLGNAEWTLFLGDSQAILQQYETKQGDTGESREKELQDEIYEDENGIMMSPLYGEMVKLEDSLLREARDDLMRQIEDNWALVGATAALAPFPITGNILTAGQGLASLPFDNPVIGSFGALAVIKDGEDSSEAYYPKNKDDFRRYLRDRATSSSDQIADEAAKLMALSNNQIDKIFETINTGEFEREGLLSFLHKIVQESLNPTTETEWRRNQIRAFNSFLSQANASGDVNIDQVRNLVRKITNEYAKDTTAFRPDFIVSEVGKINQLIEANGLRLSLEDSFWLKLEQKKSLSAGATWLTISTLGINPRLPLDQQHQMAEDFRGDAHWASSFWEGVIESGAGDFGAELFDGDDWTATIIDGVFYVVKGGIQTVVPYEIGIYFLETIVGKRELSMQQFAYTYGGVAASVMVFSVASNLAQLKRPRFIEVVGKGLWEPISVSAKIFQPERLKGLLRLKYRSPYHSAVSWLGGAAHQDIHINLKYLEKLRYLALEGKYANPLFRRGFMKKYNNVAIDYQKKLSGFNIPGASLENLKDGSLLDQIEREISQERIKIQSKNVRGGPSVFGRKNPAQAARKPASPEQARALVQYFNGEIERGMREWKRIVEAAFTDMRSGNTIGEQLIKRLTDLKLKMNHKLKINLSQRQSAYEALSPDDKAIFKNTRNYVRDIKIQIPRLRMPMTFGRGSRIAALGTIAGLISLEVYESFQDDEPSFWEAGASDNASLRAARESVRQQAEVWSTELRGSFLPAQFAGLANNAAQAETTATTTTQAGGKSEIHEFDWSGITVSDVEAFATVHQSKIEEILKMLKSNAEQREHLKTILRDEPDQKMELGTAQLSLKSGQLYLDYASETRFTNTFWSILDAPETVVGSAAGLAADISPVSGTYRDFRRAWRARVRGQTSEMWKSIGWGALGLVADATLVFGVGAGIRAGMSGVRLASRVGRVAGDVMLGMGVADLLAMRLRKNYDRHELIV